MYCYVHLRQWLSDRLYHAALNNLIYVWFLIRPNIALFIYIKYVFICLFYDNLMKLILKDEFSYYFYQASPEVSIARYFFRHIKLGLIDF